MAAKRLTINAYTATGAMTIVKNECRKRGIRIRNVAATLLPRIEWRDNASVAAFETTDHVGQRNATYIVHFQTVE